MTGVLAIDIGGTKTLACLVRDGAVVASRSEPTPRDSAPDAWLAGIGRLAAGLPGGYRRAGVAVTGVVAHGRWTALNPAVLPVPDGFPLEARLEALLQVPVTAMNDAQAAAWGEYSYGAGRGARSMLFVTVSTGVGGGAVVDGRLLQGRSGLAASFGQLGLAAGTRLEERLAGQWMAREAERNGFAEDAAGVLRRAEQGEGWAEAVVGASAAGVARLLADLQLLFDPDRVVVGGGIGLAPGYLPRVGAVLAALEPRLRPVVVPAALGAHAGAVGAAALALEQTITGTETEEVG